MTEEELLKEKARTEGARISYTWLKRHLADFDQSEQSAKQIGDYMKANNLEFSEENLEKSFQALRAQGVSFTAAIVAPAAAASAPVIPAAPAEEPLPEVPGMGAPQIHTVADIKNMPPERYRKLYGTTHCPNLPFRARVNEILKRGK